MKHTINPKPTFGQCVAKFFRNSLDFDGRARRSEYWKIVLFNLVTLGVLSPITIIAGLSLAVRRLHDTGKSGWYLLVGLIPFVGSILLLVAMCSDSKKSQNKYGSSPKYQPLPEKPEGTPSTPFFQAWIDSMKNIFNFKGRARTSEFWKPFVMNSLIIIAFWFSLSAPGIMRGCDKYDEYFIYTYIITAIIWGISNMSLLARRLHDIGKEGKFALVLNSIMNLNLVFFSIFPYLEQKHIDKDLIATIGLVAIIYGCYLLGQIYLLYKDSQPGTNKWGTSPKYPEEA